MKRKTESEKKKNSSPHKLTSPDKGDPGDARLEDHRQARPQVVPRAQRVPGPVSAVRPRPDERAPREDELPLVVAQFLQGVGRRHRLEVRVEVVDVVLEHAAVVDRRRGQGLRAQRALGPAVVDGVGRVVDPGGRRGGRDRLVEGVGAVLALELADELVIREDLGGGAADVARAVVGHLNGFFFFFFFFFKKTSLTSFMSSQIPSIPSPSSSITLRSCSFHQLDAFGCMKSGRCEAPGQSWAT